MRLAAYTGASVALAGGVILKALHQRANFYSACVYLSQSNANLMILTNLCLLVVGYIVFGLQRLLYGRLRAIETEQLYEKAWFAVTETCLAMTIFRGEMGGWFLVMFVCLLVGKLWGWIGQGRLEILEQQPPSNPRLFHARLATSLLLSVAFNAFLLDYSVKTVLRQARPDMMVMFGFEFAVLTILSSSTAARYAISLVEIYIVKQQKRVKLAERRREIQAAREDEIPRQTAAGSEPNSTMPPEEEIDDMELDVPGWEEKGIWIFYLDLVTDFLKLVVYLCFFAILFTFYGLPIHILRDVVLTMKSFAKRILQFVRYRNATRDMNQRYPDATAEEITREDVCIICREEMRPWQQPEAANGGPPRIVSERLRPKKLPCGHLLHFACLRSWLERQQNCPTCRAPVAPTGGARQGAHHGGGIPNELGNVNAPGAQNIPGMNAPDNANAPGGGEARPRAWFLNLGPVRIGFGAGRADMARNIMQQMQNGQAGGAAPAQPPPPPPAAAAAAAGLPNRNQPTAAPQPTATESGVGHHPTNTQFDHRNAQSQLLRMEQQILQEINGLMATAEQLNHVRQLQGELARLRATQPNQNPGQPAEDHPNTTPQHTMSTAFQTPGGAAPNSTPYSGLPNQRPSTDSPQEPSSRMGAGDPRLPEGLTLPQGWCLVPLHASQPADQQTNHPTSSANEPSQTLAQPDPLLPPPSSIFASPSSPTSPDQQIADVRDDINIPMPSVSSGSIPQPQHPTQSSNSQAAPAEAGPSGEGNSASSESPFNSSRDIPRRESGNRERPGDQDSSSLHRERRESTHATQEIKERSSSASSKGKARAATVEDVDDD